MSGGRYQSWSGVGEFGFSIRGPGRWTHRAELHSAFGEKPKSHDRPITVVLYRNQLGVLRVSPYLFQLRPLYPCYELP